jgi:hypothetical protein
MPYRAMALVAAMFGVTAVICMSLPTAATAGAPLKAVDVKLGKNPGGGAAARSSCGSGGGAGVTQSKPKSKMLNPQPEPPGRR